ncbi:hypothetical protein DSO57_1020221 [Entomophthora muscae]|uniref:Uncharacterized protein n=1 Tax=Entomophthora muscae TaxID=34485 RepID=A0ACC2U360_9FUNG|nr:hypothetical protein DSO57_1020221 [Entomophthora muscae]
MDYLSSGLNQESQTWNGEDNSQRKDRKKNKDLRASYLLSSGETLVKSLTCNNLDLYPPDPNLVPHVAKKALEAPWSLLEEKFSAPQESPEVLEYTPTHTPWLLANLALMVLDAYFPCLSPVSYLWSPFIVAIPVLSWMASWWFVFLVWEPNLISLAPLSQRE